jgi:hypothetical protein
MQTKFILTTICLSVAVASVYMIFFSENFPTATAFQQRGTILMALATVFGTWYFGKEVFEIEY